MAKKVRKPGRRGPYLREIEDPDQPGTGGIRLRQHRLARAWTIERLAELAGVSTGTISSIESQRLGYSHITLGKLAKALETSVGALFDVDPRDQAGSAFWAIWGRASTQQRQRIVDFTRGVVEGRKNEKS